MFKVGDRVKVCKVPSCAKNGGFGYKELNVINQHQGCLGMTGRVVNILNYDFVEGWPFEVRLDQREYKTVAYVCKYKAEYLEYFSTKELI